MQSDRKTESPGSSLQAAPSAFSLSPPLIVSSLHKNLNEKQSTGNHSPVTKLLDVTRVQCIINAIIYFNEPRDFTHKCVSEKCSCVLNMIKMLTRITCHEFFLPLKLIKGVLSGMETSLTCY